MLDVKPEKVRVSISLKETCLAVCMSVTELFKRRGRGIALATHAVASRDAGSAS